ncbi:hypothetical protein TWF281_006491 [Arthrobotrys megalospora]
MGFSKLIFLALVFHTASIQAQGVKSSKAQEDVNLISCTDMEAINNITSVSLPPFVAVENSEPNATSKPGSQPIKRQNDPDVPEVDIEEQDDSIVGRDVWGTRWEDE